MSIYFEKKDKPDDNLDVYLKSFQFKDYEVNIKGSSMLKYNKYFGDYDLYTYIGKHNKYTTYITKTTTIDELFDEFLKIIKNTINIKDSYFIEFKIGNESDTIILTKIKEITLKKFTSIIKKFKELKYIQIEFINFVNDRFITMTSDYFFYAKPSFTILQKDLKDGIIKFLERGDYYKVLKRIFNTYQIKHEFNKKYDKNNVQYISDIFNSSLGKMVVVLSNLRCIIKLRQQYSHNERVKELCKKNLKYIGYKSNSTMKMIKGDEKELYENINTESQKLFISLFS